MAYKVIILYRLYMPSYFLGTFTEYPFFIYSLINAFQILQKFLLIIFDGITNLMYKTKQTYWDKHFGVLQ